MSDLNLPGKVSLDTSDAEKALGRVEQSAGKMAKSVRKSGEDAAKGIDEIGTGADVTSRKTEAATGRMTQSLQRLIAAEQAAADGGRNSAKYYEIRAQQIGANVEALRPLLDQLDTLKKKNAEAFSGLGAGAKNLDAIGMSAKQTAFALRQVGPQVTDIVTQIAGGQAPLQILIQQGGQLKDVFGGVGPAAKALGGYLLGLINPYTVLAAAVGVLTYAYIQGSKESREFQNALTFTGNSLGLTLGQFSELRDSLAGVAGTKGKAAEALTEVAKAGVFTRDSIQGIAEAAVVMERATGQAVKKTVEQFKELAQHPAEASAKLNEQYSYLTASIYLQIKALEDQGRAQEAASLALRTYSEAVAGRGKEIIENVGFIEAKFRSLAIYAKQGWDAVLGIGRDATGTEQLANLRKTLADRVTRGPLNETTAAAFEKGNEALRQQIALLERLNGVQEKQTSATAEKARLEKLAIDYAKQGAEFEDNAAKRERELAKARVEGLELLNKGYITQVQYEQRLAAIREKYKDQKAPKIAANAFDLQVLREYAKGLDDLGKIEHDADAKAEELSKTQAKLKEIQASPVWAQFSRQQQEQIIYAASLSQGMEDEAAAIKKVKDQREAEQRLYYGESARLDEGLRLAHEQADSMELEISLIGRSRQERDLVIAQRRVEVELAKELARIDAMPLDELDKEPLRAKARAKALIDANNVATKQVVEDWQRAADEINGALTHAFEDWILHGKSLSKGLARAIEQEFSNIVLRPIISAVLSPISGLLGGLFQGGASALLGGGSLAALFGGGAATSAAGSGFALAGSNAAFNSAIGGGSAGIGALGATGYGALIAIGATIAAKMATKVGLPPVLGAISPDTVFNLLIAQKLGIVQAPGGPKVEGGSGTGGLPSFGDTKTAQTYAQAIAAQYSNYANIFGLKPIDVGFQFGKDPKGTALSQLDVKGGSYTRSALYGGQYENVQRGDENFDKAVSLAAAQLIVKNLQDQVGGPVGDFLKGVNLTSSSLESLTSALDVAQAVGSLDKVLLKLGSSFDILRGMSAEAQKSVIDSAGGLETLSTGLGAFYDKFFTEEEKRAVLQQQVSDAFSKAGVALPATIDAYKQAVLDAQEHLDTDAGPFDVRHSDPECGRLLRRRASRERCDWRPVRQHEGAVGGFGEPRSPAPSRPRQRVRRRRPATHHRYARLHHPGVAVLRQQQGHRKADRRPEREEEPSGPTRPAHPEQHGLAGKTTGRTGRIQPGAVRPGRCGTGRGQGGGDHEEPHRRKREPAGAASGRSREHSGREGGTAHHRHAGPG
jgi:phage-related minor tail protein